MAKPLIAAKSFLPEKRLGALCSTTLGWKDPEVTWKEDKRPNISTCLTYRNPTLPLPPQSDYDLIRINWIGLDPGERKVMKLPNEKSSE